MVNVYAGATLAQISSAAISFTSSLTLSTAICRSSGGLTTPFRRLIFGLSVSDVGQSLSLLLGPFATQASDITPYGLGNQTSCSAQGILLLVSCNWIPMYTCALIFYYYCTLILDMSKEDFTKAFERKAHIAIVLVGISVSAAALLAKTINPYVTGTFCSASAVPADCRQHPELYDECIGANTVFIFELVFLANLVLCCVFIIRNSYLLLRNVLNRDRAFGPINNNAISSASDLRRNSSISRDRSGHGDRSSRHSSVSQDSTSPAQVEEEEHKRKVEMLRRDIRRTMTIQQCMYVAAFFSTYFIYWLYVGMLMLGLNPTSSHLILSELTCPLGGLLNILVFARPHVWMLRRKLDISWPRAFIMVIKAGGRVSLGDETDNQQPSNQFVRGSSYLPDTLGSEEALFFRDLESLKTPSISFGRLIAKDNETRDGLITPPDHSTENRNHFHGRIVCVNEQKL
jgi:hypothetical protein